MNSKASQIPAMRTVDEILAGHRSEMTSDGAELAAPLPRFSRRRHAETVRRLSSISGLRSSLLIAFQWAVLVGCGVAATWSGNWLVYVLCGIVVATRYQALGVLMHDGAHFLLYRNRSVNDVVCDLFVAFPIGMSTTLYRKTHFRHHRHVNTEEDQDLAAFTRDLDWYEWPKSAWGLTRTLFISLLGLNLHRAWTLYKHWSPGGNLFKPLTQDFPLRARLLFMASLIGVYSASIWGLVQAPRITIPLLLMYFIPMLTALNLINRIRAAAEHLGTRRTCELDSTRTVIAPFWERAVISPLGVNYHLEHHLFPSVPGPNLSRLHRELMRDEEFRSQAQLTNSYVGVFREWMASESEPEGESEPDSNSESEAAPA